MSLTYHHMTLNYTVDDDGIHLSCSCGNDAVIGFQPTPQEALAAADAHLDEMERQRVEASKP